jgi:uncharacterized protein
MTAELAAGTLGGLLPSVWDDLAGPHFYSTSAWLRLCASGQGARAGAAVSRASSHVAAVPVYELTAPPSPLYRWDEILSARGLPCPPPLGLLIGPRLGYQAHILLSRDADAVTAVAGVVDEVRRLHRLCPDETCGCVAMYLSTADAVAARAAGVEALPVLLEADSWIEVPPGGWEEWLDSLSSKRRSTVRREMLRFEAAGYQVEHLALADCYERLGALAAATELKYGHAAEPEDYAAILRRHIEGTGDEARVAVCSRDDAGPVGFCLYYRLGDTIFLRWAGFDYARLAGAAEYFNLVFYSQIMLAAATGARWVHAGITAREGKALRGAQLRPLWLVDLAEDSVLARCQDQIRLHNAHFLEGLKGDSRTAGAIADEAAWRVFM